MRKKKQAPAQGSTPESSGGKMLGRRFQILCLVSHAEIPKEGFWSAAGIAEACGISRFTSFNALTRFKGYGLVESSETGREAKFRREYGSGKIRIGSLPMKVLAWSITPKGQARVQYVGGHQEWCPVCMK